MRRVDHRLRRPCAAHAAVSACLTLAGVTIRHSSFDLMFPTACSETCGIALKPKELFALVGFVRTTTCPLLLCHQPLSNPATFAEDAPDTLAQDGVRKYTLHKLQPHALGACVVVCVGHHQLT